MALEKSALEIVAMGAGGADHTMKVFEADLGCATFTELSDRPVATGSQAAARYGRPC